MNPSVPPRPPFQARLDDAEAELRRRDTAPAAPAAPGGSGEGDWAVDRVLKLQAQAAADQHEIRRLSAELDEARARATSGADKKEVARLTALVDELTAAGAASGTAPLPPPPPPPPIQC